MNTEIPDNTACGPANGWVLFDAQCRLCVGLARRLERLLATRGLRLVPLQADWVCERLGRDAGARPKEMGLLTLDGQVYGGASAILQIARHYWWARWIAWLGQIPLCQAALNRGYRWFAARRHCANGVCRTPATRKESFSAFDRALLLMLPLAAALATWHLPPWVFMWSVAVAMGMAAKWLTFRDALRHGAKAGTARTLGWFLAWPGLDGRAFFSTSQSFANPARREWLVALAKLVFGIALIWTAAPLALPFNSLLAGWLAMVGIVFVLHFGAFHLLSLLWRKAGVNAPPIMRNPMAATSLAEFWGVRWNTAFSIPARRLVLIPLARRMGLGVATVLVFLLSGTLHELVISLPARGGWGLPTMYFIVQAFGLVFERSAWGKRFHLASGWQGWLFTVAVTAIPAFGLFHPPFVHQVILPMLQALGAT